ncbi:pirin family protein [Thiomicrospira microaerophila]|uniref:pirin family protein n=1 Tax=Thiomicrospira microaerophila TaxID=406020 RepID=UPI00200C98C3|nr:pirin family protein [Thiomicrospira microaerophila]UQB42202.1 pirin family protein [Thiomicrospira microaerophila]
MIRLRPSAERGYNKIDWLESYHSFSFSSYFDRNHMNFRSLRVINEDWIQPNSGFPTHPHDNMEIITYLIEGRLAHKDSMGNVEEIQPGEIQCMSAGTGITHSEYNPSSTEVTHLYQIWLMPAEKNIQPGYQQIRYDLAEPGNLVLLASQNPTGGAVFINQDVDLYRAELNQGQEVKFDLRPGRGIWLQCVKGTLDVNGESMQTGDALAVEDEPGLVITTDSQAEFLLFDLV